MLSGSSGTYAVSHRHGTGLAGIPFTALPLKPVKSFHSRNIERLIRPVKFYGRDTELDRLATVLRSGQSDGGRTEIVFFTGASGAGKTALAQQFSNLARQSDAVFISGKFEQLKKNVPFSALSTAFRALIRDILDANAPTQHYWNERIYAHSGADIESIANLIPELMLLMGDRQYAGGRNVSGSVFAFSEIFRRFVTAFCRPGFPLCLFLDDMQWIDTASRQLLESLLTNDQSSNLIFLGAYRESDVDAAHPLLLMKDRMTQSGVRITEIPVAPLSFQELQALGDDLFPGLPPDKLATLSMLVLERSRGNALFAERLLLALRESEIVAYDAAIQRWDCDISLVQIGDTSTDIIQLLQAGIRSLPVQAQQALKIASCIGYQFDCHMVAVLAGLNAATVADAMAFSLGLGLVSAIGYQGSGGYQFLHDRVQQAANMLMPEAEQCATRLQIGRLLILGTKNVRHNDRIFEIADQFNAAATLIDLPQERRQLLEINLVAAERARDVSAFEHGLKYIRTAVMLHEEDPGAVAQGRKHALFSLHGDLEHWCGFNEIASECYLKALAHADTDIDTAAVQLRRVHYYSNLRQFTSAYDAARAGLRVLGVSLPHTFSKPLFALELTQYRLRMLRKTVPELADLPEMTNQRARSAFRLLAAVARATYQISPSLCSAIGLKMTIFCLRYGNMEGCCSGYCGFGILHQGVIGNSPEMIEDFGQLALDLANKYNDRYYSAQTYFVVGYFSTPWRAPATLAEKYWQISYETSLITGDLFHASCAACATIQSCFMRGQHFSEIRAAASRYMNFFKSIENEEGEQTILAVTQAIANLCGETESRLSYNAPGFREDIYLSSLATAGQRHFAHFYFINKMQTLYLWGAYEEAVAVAEISAGYLEVSVAMLHTAEHYFYEGLIISEAIRHHDQPAHYLRERLAQNVSKFERYSAGCPDNFYHKYLILLAELEATKGNIDEAVGCLHHAADTARQYGYLHIEALAYERLAWYAWSQRATEQYKAHMQQACTLYERWGALAYAEFLPQKIGA